MMLHTQLNQFIFCKISETKCSYTSHTTKLGVFKFDPIIASMDGEKDHSGKIEYLLIYQNDMNAPLSTHWAHPCGCCLDPKKQLLPTY